MHGVRFRYLNLCLAYVTVNGSQTGGRTDLRYDGAISIAAADEP